MFNFEAEAHVFHLRNLPLVHRLKSRGISLDSETYLARGLNTVGDAALSWLPLIDRGTPTVVARYEEARAFGQFRHRPGDPHAHIVFIAPALTNNHSPALEGAWLYLLDALAQVAARRGAHAIHAEVAEDSAVFEALRQTGYAPYARQDIWRRAPAAPPGPDHATTPRWAGGRDMAAIRYLHACAVPRLARQADPSPSPEGLVFYREGRAYCYLAVSEGNRGLYLKPYLEPQARELAGAVLSAALAALPRSARMPVYCCVRQYQGWLGRALEELGFQPWARQTVMVKHTAARVEHPAFAPLPSLHGGIPISGGPTAGCQLVERDAPLERHRPAGAITGSGGYDDHTSLDWRVARHPQPVA